MAGIKNRVPFPYLQIAQQTTALHPSAGQHRPRVGKLQRSGDMDMEQRSTLDTVRNSLFYKHYTVQQRKLGINYLIFLQDFKLQGYTVITV